jgi:alkylation response protein AidB-like acyl-CoA dehydrogenase
MLVARTDPDAPKHKGLTYFLMDMEEDGIEVKPLRQITGEAEFNEIFMEDVRIPDENRIGDEGAGWSVAITTLMNERAGLAFAAQAGVQTALEKLVKLAQATKSNGGSAADDPVVRQKLATFLASVNTADLDVLRGLIDSGQVTPVLDRRYTLDTVGEAIAYLEEGHARGKVMAAFHHELYR